MRIGGLVSGMDIDQMVKDLMRAEKMPMERLLQQKTLLEWKQEDSRALNRKLFSFRNQMFNFKLQSTFNVKNAVSSNPSAVNASVAGAANDGIYTMEVTQLAKGAFKTSGTINPHNPGARFLAQQFNLNSSEIENLISFSIGDGQRTETFTFNVNQATIHDVINEINKRNFGVGASYDANLNRVFLMSRQTGAAQKIELQDILTGNNLVKDGTGNPLRFLASALFFNTGIPAQGQDAAFIFNGTSLTQSSNTFTIAGINFNLLARGTATVRVSGNIEGVFNQIKDFVEKFNVIIEDANKKLSERTYRAFPPLSDEQKEQMSEKEIQLWEQKARSGLFRNDNILINFVSNIRRALSEPVQGLIGQNNSLAAIGISTRSWHEGGKLHIDEAKLRRALQEDLEGVKQLFTKTSTNSAENGIGDRIYRIVNDATRQITESVGRETGLRMMDDSHLGQRLNNLNKQIDSWQDRLKTIEDRYWRQFTAMEKALNQMYSQSMWMGQQFMNNRQ